MSLDRTAVPSPRSTLLKDVAYFTFVGIRRAALEVVRTPGYARSVARDVRDAWRESAVPTPRDGRPPF
jgi:hypothetical protein